MVEVHLGEVPTNYLLTHIGHLLRDFVHNHCFFFGEQHEPFLDMDTFLYHLYHFDCLALQLVLFIS